MWIYRLTNIFYLRCCPFPSLYFWCPYRGLVDCMCVFISGFFVLFHRSICLVFWWCHPASVTTAMEYSLKSESVMPPALFFFLKVALAIWGLLWFHMFQQPHFLVLIQRNLNQNLKEIPVLPCLLQHYSQYPRHENSQNVHCWIKKIWYICTMEYHPTLCKEENLPFATVWMDLENIVCALSRVQLFATPWTVAHQPPQWVFLGKNTEVSCHLLLQRIFPTQIVNSHLVRHLHWLVDSLPLGFTTWETQKALCPVKKVSYGETNTVWLHLHIKSKIVKLTEAASRMVVGRDCGRKREWGGNGQSEQNFTAGWIRSGALLSSMLSISNSTVLHT